MTFRFDRLTSRDIIECISDVDVVLSQGLTLINANTQKTVSSFKRTTFLLKHSHWTVVIYTTSAIIYFDPYGLEVPFAQQELMSLDFEYLPISYQPANLEDKLCGNYCAFAVACARRFSVSNCQQLHTVMRRYLFALPKHLGVTESIGPGLYPIADHSQNTSYIILFSCTCEIGHDWKKYRTVLNAFIETCSSFNCILRA
jgi:hypothetical protein